MVDGDCVFLQPHWLSAIGKTWISNAYSGKERRSGGTQRSTYMAHQKGSYIIQQLQGDCMCGSTYKRKQYGVQLQSPHHVCDLMEPPAGHKQNFSRSLHTLHPPRLLSLPNPPPKYTVQIRVFKWSCWRPQELFRLPWKYKRQQEQEAEQLGSSTFEKWTSP